MSGYVVDCSVSAGWYLPDEYTKQSAELLERVLNEDFRLIEPELWWYENMNVMRSAVTRNRITPTGARRALANLERIPWEHQATTRENRMLIVDAALELELSAYDATYFIIAQMAEAQLVTQDEDLLNLSPRYDWIVSLEDVR